MVISVIMPGVPGPFTYRGCPDFCDFPVAIVMAGVMARRTIRMIIIIAFANDNTLGRRIIPTVIEDCVAEDGSAQSNSNALPAMPLF